MTPILYLAVAAALQAVSPGAASPAPALGGGHAAATPTAASVPLDADRVVCRRLTQTGSRLGGNNECATKAQWRERERENADYLRQSQAKAYQFSQH